MSTVSSAYKIAESAEIGELTSFVDSVIESRLSAHNFFAGRQNVQKLIISTERNCVSLKLFVWSLRASLKRILKHINVE